jgi:hypothetical protein
MGPKRNEGSVLVGKLEGRRQLGGTTRGLGDNIKIDLRETECGRIDWIHLAQDRDQWRAVVNTVMNLQVP